VLHLDQLFLGLIELLFREYGYVTLDLQVHLLPDLAGEFALNLILDMCPALNSYSVTLKRYAVRVNAYLSCLVACSLSCARISSFTP
jgi:hypothetical protein